MRPTVRRQVLPLLAALNLALAGVLAWLWVTPEGQLRDVRWPPPQPVRPALAEAVALPTFEVDLSRYVATLERPLFESSRRPPPPQSATAVPAPEPMPDIRLLGLYGNAGAGGMIARIDGKVRRLQVGESVGGWVLREKRAGEIDVSRGEEIRTLRLTRSTEGEPAPPNDMAASGASAGSASAPAAGAAAASPKNAYMQSEQERVRTQVRRMNVLRARAGMPPLPEP